MTQTTARKKRARQGEVVNYETPNWQPLLELARVYVGEFMWMCEIELKDGTAIRAYKHYWTRRYLYLATDGRCFGWCGDSKYREIEVESVFDLVVGRPDTALGIPGYIKDYGESDGFDAR